MAETVLMPQLGISEDSAILTAWHVREGDAVKTGQKLFSIETGKSSFDVESEYAGTVLALFAAEGDEVAVKAPVCSVGDAGEAAAPPQPPPAAASSPRARALAEKLDVDIAPAEPTGPGGRVIERDVYSLSRSVTAPSEREPKALLSEEGAAAGGGRSTDRPLSGIRKIIAKNMLASLQNTAQLTHTASFDASAILNCRKRFKADPVMSGVTLGDMVLFAVTRVLKDFPALNAHLIGDTLRVFNEVNLAAAVDTGRGLMVPGVFGACGLTLPELSERVKTLAEQCRNGTAPPDILTGGSFTVSNLGAFGTESFTPILNAPQTGILGVNTITHRVREGGSVYPAMALSLTYDHRALDGAPASRFLQTLCKALEDFRYDI
jgi:pyruvate dehydrogenase E2 component (dihydrolipoamide acetyltransferase)